MSVTRPGRRRPTPASGQAVWTAAELSPADWMIPLGTEDAAEIAAALDAIAAAAPEPAMPRCAALFASLRTRLTEGRGFALLRGLAPEVVPGSGPALLGLFARHLGEATDAEVLGPDAAPGYEAGLGPIALLCLVAPPRHATLLSAGGLHNAVLLRDRALLAELYEPMPVADEQGLSAEPVFAVSDDGFAGRFAPDRIAAAEEEPHRAPISGRQRAAIAMLSALAEDAEHALRIELRPGDLLCLDTRRVWLRRFAPAADGAPTLLRARF